MRGLARRLQQDPVVLSALNNMSDTQRLFPMQPIRLPADTPIGRIAPLRLGAIQAVTIPDALIQGRTGRLLVQSNRPLSMTATWNGLPVAFTPLAAAASITETVQPASAPATEFALLPAPALIAPGPYIISLTYAARNGFVLQHSWPVNVLEGPYETQDIELPDEGRSAGAHAGGRRADKAHAGLDGGDAAALLDRRFSPPIGSEYATTSPFGTRRSYNGGPVASYHSGQDFGAPEGVTITVPAPGVVALAEPLNVRGNAVVIDHGAVFIRAIGI
ncbi:MAG: M23 family metallopeptidase [Caldilineaceae bacterium]